VKGWTPDGQEVELTERQAECVRALLARFPSLLPARLRGFGWSVVLATAARYDAAHSCGCVPASHGVWLTGGCDLHNPSTGLLIDKPVQLTGTTGLIGVKVDLWADITPVTPEQFIGDTDDARENSGTDCE
jgi:hypothetical protein